MELLVSPQAFIPDYSGFIPDMRLVKRGKSLFQKLSVNPCSSIQRLSETKAEQKAYYRFLDNDKVEERQLTKEAANRVKDIVKGRHVLCIQDTCEINLSNHKGRLKPDTGLGRSDRPDTSHCFKLHPGLVLDAKSFSPLGFSDIKMFHRDEDMPLAHERNYHYQPIEEKESYKWIEVCQNSKPILADADQVTFIQDREGDIFEQFVLVADEKHRFIVRSRSSRKLVDGKDLYEQVGQQPVLGTYTIELPTDARKDQQKRKAIIEVRVLQCEIQCPANLRKKGYPKSFSLSCIWVKEIGAVKNPVDWKLLTTHQVDNFEQGLQIVYWYSARWHIEQVFRLLKKQGFGIESVELETGWAIRKLVVLQIVALLKILQMNIAYAVDEGGSQPIEEVFDQNQIGVLELMNDKLQGKTEKLQNKHDPTRIKWAAWVVGRLGGWKGYDSQGPPGVITLIRGMERLSYIMEGMKMAAICVKPDDTG